jgi:hypothetical protein
VDGEMGRSPKEYPETNMLSSTAKSDKHTITTVQRCDVAFIRPPRGGSIRRGEDVVNAGRSYHISYPGGSGSVRTVEAIAAFARDHGSGSYSVDVDRPDLFDGSPDFSKSWGEVIHHRDGKIAIHIHPISEPA